MGTKLANEVSTLADEVDIPNTIPSPNIPKQKDQTRSTNDAASGATGTNIGRNCYERLMHGPMDRPECIGASILVIDSEGWTLLPPGRSWQEYFLLKGFRPSKWLCGRCHTSGEVAKSGGKDLYRKHVEY